MKNTLQVSVEFCPDYNEDSLNEAIKNKIINDATSKYLEDLEINFTEKLDALIYMQAEKIVKGIDKIELGKCNTTGIKEIITMEEYIIKKAIASLDDKVDSYGRPGNSSSDKTIVQWQVKKTIENGDKRFMNELKERINEIEENYRLKLQEMVVKTLSPIYEKLIKQLKS